MGGRGRRRVFLYQKVGSTAARNVLWVWDGEAGERERERERKRESWMMGVEE